MSAQRTVRVLFVCLGNICRSPTAHGMMRKRLEETGLSDRITVDSAGTGDWHIGKRPDARARATAQGRGLDIDDLRARQVAVADFTEFDYVIGMDHENVSDLRALADTASSGIATVALLGDFSTRHAGRSVDDPYFGGEDGFERVFDMVSDCVDGLIEHIQENDLGPVNTN